MRENAPVDTSTKTEIDDEMLIVILPKYDGKLKQFTLHQKHKGDF